MAHEAQGLDSFLTQLNHIRTLLTALCSSSLVFPTSMEVPQFVLESKHSEMPGKGLLIGAQ